MMQDFKPPPGLTGDIIQDTVLVDKRVEQLSTHVAISQPEKVLFFSHAFHANPHPDPGFEIFVDPEPWILILFFLHYFWGIYSISL